MTNEISVNKRDLYFSNDDFFEVPNKPHAAYHASETQTKAHQKADALFIDINPHEVTDIRANSLAHLSHAGRSISAELSSHSLRSSQYAPSIRAPFLLGQKRYFLFVFILLLAVLLFVFSKPILDQQTGQAQIQAAMQALEQAKKTVKQEALQHYGVFPEQLTIQSQTEPFAIVVHGTTMPKTITLTFNEHAVEPLQSQDITLRFIENLPNIAFWQCQLPASFPSRYKPSACFY